MKKIIIILIIVVVFVIAVRGFYLFKAESIRHLDGSVLFSGSLTKWGKTVTAIGIYNFTSKKSIIFEEENVVFDAQITPDGENVVYGKNGSNNIYIKNIKNGKTDVFLDSSSDDVSYSVPFWSKDGTKMIFLKGKLNETGSLYLKDTTTNNIQKVIDGEIKPQSVSLSPNGQKIAFKGYLDGNNKKEKGEHTLYIYDLETGKYTALMDARLVVSYGWSPNSDKLCYISQRDNQIHILDINNMRDRAVTRTKNMGWTCNFSPDGAKIIFDVVPSFGPLSATTPREIYIINTDGSGLERIYPEGNWNSVHSPLWFTTAD